MLTTDLLKMEFRKPEGVFSPAYYKGFGCCGSSVTEKRANAVFSLFTNTVPIIYHNDLIVGSCVPVWTTEEEEKRQNIEKAFNQLGERTFRTNYDHFAPDYAYITEKGVPGVLSDITASVLNHAEDSEKQFTLECMKTAMEGFLGLIRNYRRKAETLYGVEGYNKKQLDFITGNLQKLEDGAPETFAQALQLVWLCHTAFCMEGRYAMALGRIDQYLYSFYKKDTESGLLTDALATELLENAFIKIYEQRVCRDEDDVVNICVGGKNIRGETDVNGLSYCVLKAVKGCNVPGPNLSARIDTLTPDKFLDECLKVIGTGLGYPALMNDDSIIAALSKCGYDAEDVYNFCMVGCIENFLQGKQPPWSDGRFDAPRFFEYLFNAGSGIGNDGKGIDTGDVESISSMDELMQRFEKQLAFGVKQYCEAFIRENTALDPKVYSSPFLSCFCRECVERGRDINAGGTKYPSVHGAALMGIGTTADALAAIEQTVFIDKTATLSEIRDALLCNFEGKEELRQLLLAAPKYGNNDDFADKYAVWYADFLNDEFDKYRTPDGGKFYTLLAANVSNIHAGHLIAATPDGRLAGEPISDASSPTYGRDVSGATATLLSCSKPDYTRVAGGTVLNQKYMPDMFSDGSREKLQKLIRVYFSRGGQEIQINATSTKVLKDAMEHPENYKDLVVRVSGFSAFYVTLNREVQEDILRRTQKNE